MKDKRLADCMEQRSMPLDRGRMRYGGFKTSPIAEPPALAHRLHWRLRFGRIRICRGQVVKFSTCGWTRRSKSEYAILITSVWERR